VRNLTRRQFAKLVVGGVTLSALGNCAPEELSQATATAAHPTSARPPAAARPPTSRPVLTPTPTASRPILRSDNVKGFYVRFHKPFEALDPDRWTLSIEGLVRNPQKLSLSNVLALPRTSQVSRMKCVECWSAAAHWEGFHLGALMELANPEPGAQWVHFRCADGYYESMSVQSLLRDRVLFVHHMNGEILPDIYGAPLRLMVPFLYGYKSAKAIVRIEFAEEEMPGYWPAVSSFTTAGMISAGSDNPLDLKGYRKIEGGSEIFYPDGIESLDRGG
jgi:sulfoxide reductase catalytic subunit YedY